MQVTYLLKGLFGRACRSLGGVTEPIEAIRDECGQLRGLLAAKLVQINTNLEGEHVVCGSDSVFRASTAVQMIVPQFCHSVTGCCHMLSHVTSSSWFARDAGSQRARCYHVCLTCMMCIVSGFAAYEHWQQC
jgi:hypothetical protein